MCTGTSSQDLGACENSGQWPDNGQDSSGSDHQPEYEDNEQQTRSSDTKPCFILGEDIYDVKQSEQCNQMSDTMLKSINNDGNQPMSEQVVSMIDITIYILYIYIIYLQYVTTTYVKIFFSHFLIAYAY